ncbi:MAG: Fur family transcriptional regulator [Actinomycetota bacterium]|jgi:Fur family peroxide stress response transcriptional regulator|nr:Fur family transcriptional regulator [Actinomycetota bacterium]
MNLKQKNDLMQEFKKICREKRMKVTPQRTIIYNELLNSYDHPNVETLYNRVRKTFPDISFDTVYRTLSFFHEIGIAEIIEGLSSTRRYEGNTDKHYHFICQKCGRIYDIENVPFNFQVPKEVELNYDVRNTRILFEGICKNCLAD